MPSKLPDDIVTTTESAELTEVEPFVVAQTAGVKDRRRVHHVRL
jgi:hypothetical protein